MVKHENLMREIAKLFTELETSAKLDDSNRYNEGIKTWNNESASYAGRLMGSIKELQRLLLIEEETNKKLEEYNSSLYIDLDWYHQRLRKESNDKD